MKKLKTTIEIGGALNDSFADAAKKASLSVEGVGNSIRNIELKQSKIVRFSALQKEVDKTASSFHQSNSKLASLKQEIDSTDRPSKQLISDFKSTEKETKKLEKTLSLKQERAKSLKKSLADLGVSESNLRRENAKLAVSMQLSQKRFEALSQISGADLKGKLFGVGRQVRNISLGFAGMGAAVGAASYKLVSDIGNNADSIAKLSARVGMSAESLQKWQYAAERSGVPTEKLNKSLDMLSKRLGKARTGQGALYAGLSKSDNDLLNELMMQSSTEDALKTLINRTHEMDENKRAAVMEATVGSLAMGSLTSQSMKDIEGLMKEKEKLGLITNKTAGLGEDFADVFLNVGESVKGAKANIAGELLPVFIKLGKEMTNFITGQEKNITKWAKSLGQTIQTVVPQFLSATHEFANGFGAIIAPASKVVSLFGGWKTVAYTLGAVLAGKVLLSVVSLGRAIVTTTIAVRALALTSLPGLIAGLATFSTTAIGAATTAIPAVITGIRAMSLALISTPIGAAIKGLVVGGSVIYTVWSLVGGLFEKLKNTLKGFSFFKRWFGGKSQDININDKKEPQKADKPIKAIKPPKTSIAKAAALSAPLLAATPIAASPDKTTESVIPPITSAQALKAPVKLPVSKSERTKPAKVTQHINISLQTQSHQNHEQIAESVIDKLEKRQAQLNRGAFHD